MIEGQAEPARDLGLNLMHLRAIFRNRLARLGRRQLCGGAMLVRGADEHHLMPHRPVKAREQVCGQLTAHQIAQVLDPVDVRNGRGDQNPSHVAPLCRC